MSDRTDEILNGIKASEKAVLEAIEGRRQQDSVTGMAVVEEIRGMRRTLNWVKDKLARFFK